MLNLSANLWIVAVCSFGHFLQHGLEQWWLFSLWQRRRPLILAMLPPGLSAMCGSSEAKWSLGHLPSLYLVHVDLGSAAYLSCHVSPAGTFLRKTKSR